MITAGPTYEKIDPVRFIGNYSSGKMGFALAEECARRGAQVTLITGPVQLKTKHSRIRRVDVESAEEMYAASQIYFPDADAGILCAAVADYRPETVADKKIKREKEEELTLHLQATQDIAANLGALKGKNQLLVGFALETNNEQQNAEGKLERKNYVELPNHHNRKYSQAPHLVIKVQDHICEVTTNNSKHEQNVPALSYQLSLLPYTSYSYQYFG